jgi:glutaredoxin
MNQLGINFDEVDLRQHPDIVEQFKEKGHLSAPIVKADETIWSGFRFERIRDLAFKLKLEKAHEPFTHKETE